MFVGVRQTTCIFEIQTVERFAHFGLRVHEGESDPTRCTSLLRSHG